eukprot:gene10097-13572_t
MTSGLMSSRFITSSIIKISHSKPEITHAGTKLFATTVPILLEGELREESLQPLFQSGWSVVSGRDAIKKSYKFADFINAFGFMTKCALHAEKLNHHPEWFNVYNNVDVTLSTHDCNGLSKLDIELATIMDNIHKSN